MVKISKMISLVPVRDAAMWKYVTPSGKTLYSDSRKDLIGIAKMFEFRQRAGKVMG